MKRTGSARARSDESNQRSKTHEDHQVDDHEAEHCATIHVASLVTR